MSELLTRKSQLAVEEEAVEGTAETIVAADAVHASEIKVTPEVEAIDRNLASASLSPIGKIVGGISAKASFEIELKGSGTAGTPPEFSSLLKACGFAETIVASTSVTYLPASSAIPALTIAHFMDGKRFQMAGARGTVKIVLAAGQLPKLVFEFTGTSYTEADAALLSGVTYQSTKPVAFMSAAFALHGHAGVIDSLEIDVANTVTLRKDANAVGGYAGAAITAREPKMTCAPEDVLVATKDWYSILTAGTEGALTATVGSTAGNICTITAPKTQLVNRTPGERDGAAIQDMELTLNRDAGDDELSLAFT